MEENENNVHELTLAAKYQELIVTNVSCGGCHTILVGKRHETSNGETDDKQQQDQLKQKKNPLPPLKIPIARIPSEHSDPDKPEEVPPVTENGTTENGTNGMTSPSMEEIIEKPVNGTVEIVNNVEKPVSPKKLSDYEEVTNEINGEHKEVSENNNGEHIEIEGEMDKKIDVKEPIVATSPTSPGSGVSIVTLEEENTAEVLNEEQDIMEKPSSPPLPIPPPKPPRQKIDSAENSQASRQGSSSSRLGSHESGEKDLNETTDLTDGAEAQLQDDTEVIDNSEEEKTKEEGSLKKSAGSEKSISAKSKAGTDDTAEADAQNCLDDLEDKVPVDEIKNEVIADDEDVVHSPPPRTGMFCYLFYFLFLKLI